ncbi:putative phage tail protein [Clostridium lundense]|uniref:putative phage tail protein n=1 Tax=Clostridium lundense TaxID=319475 RepID=UPI000A5853DC|nr:putative phage tail protein [Clostridium lundense]
MMDFLQNYFKDTSSFKAVVNIGESQFKKLDNFIDDCINQLYVETATWGLDFWDKYAGIKTSSFEIQERRKRINAKISSLKPLTSSLKAVIYDAKIGFKSSFLFQVTIKSEEQFGDIVNFIFEQIDLRKPAHISYELVLDYFSILSLKVLFNKYFSERLDCCGTLDVSGNSIESTIGRAYRDKLFDIFKSYKSSPLFKASESTVSTGLGRSYKESIKDILGSYFSELFFICSEDTVITGNGKSYYEKIQIKESSYFSDKFYVYDQTLGRRYQEKVTDKVTKYFSVLKAASESLVNTASFKPLTDVVNISGKLYLTKLPVASEEFYCRGGD